MIEPLNILVAGKPAAGKYNSIPATEPAESYELSHAQQRIWHAERMAPEKLRYNLSFCSTIEGELDVASLERAVDTVIMRHESLRTSFISRNGTPRQLVGPVAQFSLTINHIDISNYENKEELTAEIIDEEKDFPFELEGGPLLRNTLIQLGKTRFIFMLSVHHIISDEWSLKIILREVFTLYHAYSRRLENPLAPLRIQYKDFISWKNSQLQGNHLRTLENYWMNRLDKVAPVELPADFPGNSLVFPGQESIDFDISADLTTLLQKVARQHDTTLLAVLVASVSILFNCYTGQRDIIIGTPVTMRNHPELEDQVGLYIDVLPVRIILDPDKDCFKDVLQKVKQTLNDTLEYGLYPYDMLIEKLSLSNEKVRSGLVNVLVQSQHVSPLSLPEVPGLSISSYLNTNIIDKANLTFCFRKAAGCLTAAVVYNDALFKRTSINLVCENLVHITGKLLANERMVIGDMSII